MKMIHDYCVLLNLLQATSSIEKIDFDMYKADIKSSIVAYSTLSRM